ncbi:TPA: hypothetical protein ACJG9G_002352 [Salmonella enterica subsp. enterica serovar Java]
MTGNLFLKNDDRVHFAITDENGSVRMWLYKDKGGGGIVINNGYDGGGDFILRKDGGLTLGSGAQIAPNGDVYGAVWGNTWLTSWIPNQLNIRATMAWVQQNFVQNIDLTTPQTIQFWDGKGYPRGTDGAAMYNFMMVGGSSNVGWFEVRYTRVLINGSWRVIN